MSKKILLALIILIFTPCLAFAQKRPNIGIGEASGLTAGSYGHVYDAEAGIKLILIKFLSIIAGYRIFDIKAKDKPDYAKLRFHGPFAGATLRF